MNGSNIAVSAIVALRPNRANTEKEIVALILQTDLERVASALPVLALIENELSHDFTRHATLARIPAGRDVMAMGDRAEAVPLLISG